MRDKIRELVDKHGKLKVCLALALVVVVLGVAVAHGVDVISLNN